MPIWNMSYHKSEMHLSPTFCKFRSYKIIYKVQTNHGDSCVDLILAQVNCKGEKTECVTVLDPV